MWIVDDGSVFKTVKEAQEYINKTNPGWHILLVLEPKQEKPDDQMLPLRE